MNLTCLREFLLCKFEENRPKRCVCYIFIFLLQMTGLDIEKDQIIEMACLITDSDLNILAEVCDAL